MRYLTFAERDPMRGPLRTLDLGLDARKTWKFPHNKPVAYQGPSRLKRRTQHVAITLAGVARCMVLWYASPRNSERPDRKRDKRSTKYAKEISCFRQLTTVLWRVDKNILFLRARYTLLPMLNLFNTMYHTGGLWTYIIRTADVFYTAFQPNKILIIIVCTRHRSAVRARTHVFIVRFSLRTTFVILYFDHFDV